ncbi:AmmeMemoRadiSam system protein B [Methanofollis fontis]|uniref:MEMO1 family protein CUJ86_10950 n=1 Tax=Methanofollis fontis TaxID=2052832 RepID=A0A483CN40_9EURY|nr:AmmeMemoRadiSam system protein B [Methanofollis fontis]TAJ43378.1 AmmeMemoRadiSam system protein B [Methanofollis fontis]
METRPCVFAGMFYPGEPSHLEQFIGSVVPGTRSIEDALGIVSPHAGYPYSGAVAAAAFSAIKPDFDGTIIVIGPSHRGYMTCTSAIPWETPLGIVDVDTEFVSALEIRTDEAAMEDEHSLEVQVPFIKHFFPRARMVAVMMGDQSQQAAAEVAWQIGQAIQKTGRDVRIVASSDFSHYIPDAEARRLDRTAIEAIERLDIDELYRRIAAYGISTCGYGPIAAMMGACKNLGAGRGELLAYATSGDVTGDREVVGYAAIAVV